MTYNEQRIKEIVHDVQSYIDDVCQGYIEELAQEQYDSEGISYSLEQQEESYHEIYDAILLGVK